MKEMVINEIKKEIENGSIPREKIAEVMFRLDNDNPSLNLNQEDILNLLNYYDTFMSNSNKNMDNNIKKRVLINPVLNNNGISSIFFLGIITISGILIANVILYLSK